MKKQFKWIKSKFKKLKKNAEEKQAEETMYDIFENKNKKKKKKRK